MTEATQRTSDNGVSIWLDDLSRSRIESCSLQDLIANKNVVGVTTNPSIFQKALSQVGPYDAQLKEPLYISAGTELLISSRVTASSLTHVPINSLKHP